jgi:hypothetical protein
MINALRKRALLSLAVAASAVVAMPGPAMAQYHQGEDVLYYHYYYSDATYTDQVGWDRDTCNYYGVGRTATQGSWSPYEQLEPYAMCINGQLAPY